MSRKTDLITDLYRQTVKTVTKSERDWMAFLRMAAWQYKYPFSDQVCIYAQKPDAVACAEIAIWNRLDRWVNRGAHGIALIRDNGGRPVRTLDDGERNGAGDHRSDGEPVRGTVGEKVLSCRRSLRCRKPLRGFARRLPRQPRRRHTRKSACRVRRGQSAGSLSPHPEKQRGIHRPDPCGLPCAVLCGCRSAPRRV